jgi:sugar-specific transcriptional regulator TrmB
LSLKRVFKLLEHLGLSKIEAEIYVYLAKTGPKGCKDIAEDLDLTNQQLYYSLNILRNKGVIKISHRTKVYFYVLKFEELLNFFVKSDINQAEILQKTKHNLLVSWKEMLKEKNS